MKIFACYTTTTARLFVTVVFLTLLLCGPLYIASAQPVPTPSSPGAMPGPPTPSAPGSAPVTSGPFTVSLVNPLEADTLTELLVAIIDIILVFAVPIIVFFLMWSGFLYVTAGGDQTKLTTARSAFTWTVVGGVLVLGAWVLIEVIQQTVNALR